MIGAYIDRQYTYAVARIRSAELKLLTEQAVSELVSRETVKDVFSALRERGWGKDNDRTSDDLLSSEEEKLWSFIDELVPDPSVFRVFRIPADYHNLKAAIRESQSESEVPGIYAADAILPPETVKEAAAERKWDLLPDEMREPAEEAADVFLRTGDGQLLDVMIDRACLQEILRSGEESGNAFLSDYAEMTVAAADIRIAFRSALTGKDRAFLEKALAECRTVDKESLIQAAVTGSAEEIGRYLETTDYRDAVPELKKSMAAFENYCDDIITRRMKRELWESFGVGPIAAYIIAKENEIKTVRMIFAAKENGFPEEVIRERLRETYV